MKNKYFKFNIFNINIIFYLLLIILLILLFDYKLFEGYMCKGKFPSDKGKKDTKKNKKST